MDNRKKLNSKFRNNEELPESLQWDEVKGGILERMDSINSSQGKSADRIKSYKWSVLILLAFLSTCIYVSKYKSLSLTDSEFVSVDSKQYPNEWIKNTETENDQSASDQSASNLNVIEDNLISKATTNETIESIYVENKVLADEEKSEQAKLEGSIIKNSAQNRNGNSIKMLEENSLVVTENNYLTNFKIEDKSVNRSFSVNHKTEENNLRNNSSADIKNQTGVDQNSSVVDKLSLTIEKLPLQACCDLLVNNNIAFFKEPSLLFPIVTLSDNPLTSQYRIKVEQGVGAWKNSVFYFNEENTELNYSKQINLNTYIGVVRNIGRKWTVETGLKYNRLMSNISFHEERDTIIQLNYISKKRINSLTGEVLEEISTTANISALKWTRIKYTNTLNLLSVPVKINRIFPLTKNINASIGLGVNYGLVLGGSGKWLSNQVEADDQQNVILDMNNQLFNRHTFSTSSTLGLNYIVGKNIDINFNIQYSNFITDISKSNRLELKPNSVFATIGFSYHL